MAVVSYQRGYIIAGILVLILLYTASYHYRTHPLHLGTHYVTSKIFQSKQDFAVDVLEHEVSDPFDISAIAKLCSNRRARDDVIVNCSPGTGGVGNIRSYILHCTRFAMEAGASMLLPGFHHRSNSDLVDLDGPVGDFQFFFDRQHFVDVVQTACPHMTVYDSPEKDWTISTMEIPHWSDAIHVSSLDEPSPWRRQFDLWFDSNTMDMKKPVVVTSSDPGRQKAVMDDGMHLYYSFGRMLQFRPDARQLAALCIAEMNSRFKLHLDSRQNLFRNAYMGAHLRTSSDAVAAGWSVDFEQQTDWYINQTLQHNLKVIFAAGGNPVDLERFKEKAAQQNIQLVCKNDLLSGNDLRELQNMLWDQRGLIDFEILLKASQFGGYGRSSFSLNIASRRHFMSTVDDPHGDSENAFVDELSVVYGRFNADWEAESMRTMWP